MFVQTSRYSGPPGKNSVTAPSLVLRVAIGEKRTPRQGNWKWQFVRGEQRVQLSKHSVAMERILLPYVCFFAMDNFKEINYDLLVMCLYLNSQPMSFALLSFETLFLAVYL